MHTPDKLRDLLKAAKEIDRLSLVIASAVRHSDPENYEAVIAAIVENRFAISEAES